MTLWRFLFDLVAAMILLMGAMACLGLFLLFAASILGLL